MARTRVNYTPNPRMDNSTTGWSVGGTGVTQTAAVGGTVIDIPTSLGVGTSFLFQSAAILAADGESWGGSLDISVPIGFPAVTLRLATYAYGPNSPVYSPPTTINPGETQRLVTPINVVPAGTSGIRNILQPTVATTVNSRVIVRYSLAEKADYVGPYFDGSFTSDDTVLYSWTGTANNSPSSAFYYDRIERAKMMFGNERHMQAVPAPATGMDLSHGGVFDQLIFQTGRKSNHRTSQSSKTYGINIPVQEASGLTGLDVYQKFASGFYGNTEDYPLFFADPMNYDQNLFPEVWASPGLIEQGYNDINESRAQTYYNNILNPDPFTFNSGTGYSGIAGTSGVITTSTSVSSGFSVTWTTATTAVSGGMQYSGTPTFPGNTVSAGWTVSSLSTQRVQMFIDWKNAGNALISSTAGTQTVITGAAAPVELTILNATAPALAVTYDVRVIAVAGTSGVNWAIGNRLTGGFLRSNDATTLPPVSFDGDTPGAMWTGVRGASVSSYYVARIAPTFSDTAANIYNLPARKATFTIESQVNALPTINNLYGDIPYCIIPIPTGYKLLLGATGSATGTAAIRYVAYNSGLLPSQQATGTITLTSETSSTRLTETIIGAEYVKIYLQRTSAVTSTITISSMMAQLWPIGVTAPTTGMFVEGKGHRGLNFDDGANSESYVIVDPNRKVPIHYKGLSTSMTEVQK